MGDVRGHGQKMNLRLLTDHISFATVSYMVGYESPSQFNREYSSLFGLPPRTDIKLMKKKRLLDVFAISLIFDALPLLL